MVYIKTYMFNTFYEQYLFLLTMAPRNSRLHTCRDTEDIPAILCVGVAVVPALTHRHKKQSVNTGQAPMTLEWTKCLRKNKNKQRIIHMMTEAHRPSWAAYYY